MDTVTVVKVLAAYREIVNVLGDMSEKLDYFTKTVQPVDETLGAMATCYAIDVWSLEQRLEALTDRVAELIRTQSQRTSRTGG
ncbi:hypothetical protein [Amycolatopsis minnesotensis]|uniref:Uncharacterized protein n=1 Tax=Amycolatopsis minnesotensis TaxID=337894 RepID=A0ABP5EDR3_9PSEU